MKNLKYIYIYIKYLLFNCIKLPLMQSFLFHDKYSTTVLSTTWLRSQIWLNGKINLAPLHFTLCNAFWLRRLKKVQRKFFTLERYTAVVYTCTMYIRIRCRNSMLLAMRLKILQK